MFRSLSRKRRFGFTLVEVLVTTVVVGVMAAVVIPALVKQTSAADAPRVASDLGSIKAAMEVFSLNVKPRMPGDIEDLINTISTTENGLDGTAYTSGNVSKWTGPYIEWTGTVIGNAATADTIFKSAGSAVVHDALFRCPAVESGYSTGNTTDAPCTLGTGNTSTNVTDSYTAVKVTGIGAASNEFKNLNAVIDGTDEGANDANKQDFGILRQNAAGTVFFLAVPFSKP
ncbi:MAG: prepilin-type N-terminal cleavage/methylation domain-containing protein [Gemmatimonadaceae bacterium]